MSIKTLIQTRWKISANRITIYPYGILYLLAMAMAFIFGGVFLIIANGFEGKTRASDLAAMYPVYSIYFVIVLIEFLYARTTIVFDNTSRKMYKKLFGIININVIPFNEIDSIIAVRNTRGTMQYRVYSKTRRSHRGTVISAAFLNDQNDNIQSFKLEVLALIDI